MMIGDDDDDDGGNNDDDYPHPSLQLSNLYKSSIVTNSSRCLCHVLSSVALAIAQLIPITATASYSVDGLLSS